MGNFIRHGYDGVEDGIIERVLRNGLARSLELAAVYCDISKMPVDRHGDIESCLRVSMFPGAPPE